jgi:hypothetical protein
MHPPRTGQALHLLGGGAAGAEALLLAGYNMQAPSNHFAGG